MKPDSVIEKVCITIPAWKVMMMSTEQLLDAMSAFLDMYLVYPDVIIDNWVEDSSGLVRGSISWRDYQKNKHNAVNT